MTRSITAAVTGTLRRRRLLIIGSVVAAAAIMGGIALLRDPAPFRAHSAVAVQPDGESEADPTALMAAQRQVLLSAAVLEEASAQLGVLTVEELRSAIDVQVDARSGTMSIVVSDPNASVAVVGANAVAEVYVEYRTSRQVEAIQRELESVTAQISAAENRLRELSALGDVEAANLQATQAQYERLLTRTQELESKLSVPSRAATVLTTAGAATRVDRASALVQALWGVLIGAVVGLLLAALRELFDDRVHDRRDVEKVVRLPVLAELPFDPESATTKRRGSVALATVARPTSPLAEAIRSLRTAVTFLGVGSSLRCVTVTSGAPDEGKSLVAANLAVAFAQAGVRTILVSGDLRRPALDAPVLANGALGFSDFVLSCSHRNAREEVLDVGFGEAREPVDVSAVTYRTTVPNLRFVPAGRLPSDPAELLASSGTADAIAALRQRCEMLIIDSPPTIVTDGVILANLSDAVILVAAFDQSRAPHIEAAAATVSGSGARIAGIVLNKSLEPSMSYVPHGASMTSGGRNTRRGSSRRNGAAVMRPTLPVQIGASDAARAARGMSDLDIECIEREASSEIEAVEAIAKLKERTALPISDADETRHHNGHHPELGVPTSPVRGSVEPAPPTSDPVRPAADELPPPTPVPIPVVPTTAGDPAPVAPLEAPSTSVARPLPPPTVALSAPVVVAAENSAVSDGEASLSRGPVQPSDPLRRRDSRWRERDRRARRGRRDRRAGGQDGPERDGLETRSAQRTDRRRTGSPGGAEGSDLTTPGQ